MVVTRQQWAALASAGCKDRAARRIARFLVDRLRINASSVLNERDSVSKVPLCPISANELPASATRLVMINELRQVSFYDPKALYEFSTKCVDFRDPLTRREFNRVEVYRCARMQSEHPWVARTICAYALAIYDARVAKQRENQNYRHAVRNAAEVQQHAFAACLDTLRGRHVFQFGMPTAVWDMWIVAVNDLRMLDPHCAMHEAVSQMDMFMLQRELRPAQHEREYGTDFEAAVVVFTRALSMFTDAGVAVPVTTIERVSRLGREQSARRARRRSRHQAMMVRVRRRRRRQQLRSDSDEDEGGRESPAAAPRRRPPPLPSVPPPPLIVIDD